LRGPRARDHQDSRYRRELQDAIVDCWQVHPRTDLPDGGTGLARCVCRSLPVVSAVFALREYVRPRSSAIIPATQQRIFFWLCSTAQPDSRLFDIRWKAAAAGETDFLVSALQSALPTQACGAWGAMRANAWHPKVFLDVCTRPALCPISLWTKRHRLWPSNTHHP
jgi:hypothetical protein